MPETQNERKGEKLERRKTILKKMDEPPSDNIIQKFMRELLNNIIIEKNL